jgi:hypothetical protein
MIPEDEILWECNETELLQMARAQGLGHLRLGLPKEVLVALVSGVMTAQEERNPEYYSAIQFTRGKLQDLITEHWGVIRSQLPGCTGRCTKYPCSNGRHLSCFANNEHLLVT